VLVPGVNQDGSNDEGARLSDDELTIYFTSNRTGNRDMYSATRASRTASFGTPQPMGGVNSPSDEAYPSLTPDTLTIFFESNRTGRYQVHVATRSTTLGQFPTPTPAENVNSAAEEGHPYVLPDQSALYFISTRSGGGGDIYRAPIAAGAQLGTPTIVSTINTPSTESLPLPTADELVLYYGTNRADSPAKGASDIWVARRASRSADFDPPVNVQELNTPAEETTNWLSPDRCRIYFQRSGATGNKIYVASRSP
jgi:Tol biopolymer transport system component